MTYNLTPEHYQKLLTAERQLTDLSTVIPKAEECGVDCKAFRTALEAQLGSIANMKRHFGPKPSQ